MMKGPIFIALRKRMLDFYPEQVPAVSRRGARFKDWLDDGNYSITKSLKYSYVEFDAYDADIASFFLEDADLLYNAFLEHVVELDAIRKRVGPSSDCWGIVTLYYAGFFVAQALVRLLGFPVMFLTKQNLKTISELCGKNFAGGVYVLSKNAPVSYGMSSYTLRKKEGKIHELTWVQIFTFIEQILDDHKHIEATKEINFYADMVDRNIFKIYNGYNWPSTLRNEVNYTPGFYYRMVSGRSTAACKKSIEQLSKIGPAMLYRAALDHCRFSKSEQDFPHYVSMLTGIVFSLHTVLSDLYSELVKRRKVDQRMDGRRQLFIKNNIDIHF